MNQNTSAAQAMPSLRPSLLIPFPARIPVVQGAAKPRPNLDPMAGREAIARKRAEWTKLDLRQDFADETHMRGILAAARIRIANNLEPATPTRIKAILRRIWITRHHVVAAVGTNVAGFLNLNPKLPLWAALALILEAMGDYRPQCND